MNALKELLCNLFNMYLLSREKGTKQLGMERHPAGVGISLGQSSAAVLGASLGPLETMTAVEKMAVILGAGCGQRSGHRPVCLMSVCPSFCPSTLPHGHVVSSLISAQGAALKYLPSILEDVFGILDASMLG